MFTVRYGLNISRVEPENGKLVWISHFSRKGYSVDENAYISYDRNDKKLKKLDINSGEVIWEQPFVNKVVNKFEAHKNYYVGKTFRGGIHIIDKETGQELWRYKTYTSNDVSNYQIYQDKLIITDGTNKIKIFKLPD